LRRVFIKSSALGGRSSQTVIREWIPLKVTRSVTRNAGFISAPALALFYGHSVGLVTLIISLSVATCHSVALVS